jgi:hypothetical protein
MKGQRAVIFLTIKNKYNETVNQHSERTQSSKEPI